MQRLEVSGAVRLIYRSLDVKGLNISGYPVSKSPLSWKRFLYRATVRKSSLTLILRVGPDPDHATMFLTFYFKKYTMDEVQRMHHTDSTANVLSKQDRIHWVKW